MWKLSLPSLMAYRLGPNGDREARSTRSSYPISIAESLVEFQRSDGQTQSTEGQKRGRQQPRQDGSSKSYKPKEGHLGEKTECVFGVEFVVLAKAIPMIFANSMCMTEGGGTCVVPLLRGKASNTLQPCMLRCMILHQLFRERSSLRKEEVLRRRIRRSVRGDTPKLRKGHPPREKVDCARGNSSTRAQGKSHRRGRRVQGDIARGRAGGSAKPREELVHLATGTREVLQEHSKSKPKATMRDMLGDMGGGPNDGRRAD
ncbi:hypothetical protein GH714_022336 [Hevea brasiliensis]|uniref:Uncharacterized protein n=1 Tax=Hevea brasiliensis TaxID=3981 RepID=A0A6A6MWA0_HEVBR|nr:hypothetical protein GH714_022336 [Hevea brasiliensis]